MQLIRMASSDAKAADYVRAVLSAEFTRGKLSALRTFNEAMAMWPAKDRAP